MEYVTLQQVFKTFIISHSRKSANTAKTYDRNCREFFDILTGKTIEDLHVEDVQNILNYHIENVYVKRLININSSQTIETKLNCVRSFYNELLKNGFKVNPKVIGATLQAKLVNHTNAMTEDEFDGLLSYVMNSSDVEGLERFLYIKTLYVTALRKTACANLKWKDIYDEKDSTTGIDVKVVHVFDKGKWLNVPISDEFYEDLCLLKDTDNGEERVFKNMDDAGLKRVERIIRKYGNTIGKTISFHSMKATAITIGWKKTKNMMLCKQLGHHSKSATTEIYIRPDDSFVNQLSYRMDVKLDENVLEDMSKEELLDFINANEDVKTLMLQRLSIK